ncbi:MAG: anhydro-N-acetylmuramic acid kinase [Candidatus Methanomethylicota archaeon]|nr:MAG: anhydro-N-acetylmuramic acid kinase [Candidatus Verstraetearchaeota archaeon]
MDPIKRIMEIREKDEKLALGLMSGTSADGISTVIVKLKGNWTETKFKIIHYRTKKYPEKIRKEIFKIFQPETGKVDNICMMNFVLGEIFAEAALETIDEAGLKRTEIDFIASHGQTIHHMPKMKKIYTYMARSTLQIGEPSIIAERTGILTIADFRPRDIAAGGEGAPISAYADYILFRSKTKSRAVQNIGGIANVTYIPRNSKPEGIIAFDTGPGNMMIDGIIEYLTRGKMTFDENGKIAARGKVNCKLLEYLMEHPYLKRKPPKTTGRREFGRKYIIKVVKRAEKMNLNLEDILATITKYTAKTIAESYRRYLPEIPDETIIGGGGSHNKTLMKMLEEEIGDETRIFRHEDFGIPAQAKEPLILTILANEAIHGHFNNIPSATGAKRKVLMGKIIPGR